MTRLVADISSTKCSPLAAARLTPFVPAAGEHVASWVRSPAEAYWVAPRTPPPLTADVVRSWSGADRSQWLLTDPQGRWAGYGEVNVLSGAKREYWLGHLLVDPARRGRGLGLALTTGLLSYAEHTLQARRVVLVVFRENTAAVRCYAAAGLRVEGFERQYFDSYGRTENLLRMSYRSVPAQRDSKHGSRERARADIRTPLTIPSIE